MKKLIPVNIYAEITPNPLVMKFVVDKVINNNNIIEYKSVKEAKDCPLAIELFNFPFIKEIFIAKNYISIYKYDLVEWEDITLEIKDFLRNYIQQGKPLFINLPRKKPVVKNTVAKHAIDSKIIAILDEHVKPAVEMDGGNIEFHSYKNGVVSLILQGACSGCPSSTITLKSGIEQLLKKLLPNQITDVVAING